MAMKTLLVLPILSVSCLAVAVGCGKDPKATVPAHDQDAASAPAVVVTKVAEQKLTKTIRLPGELAAFRNVGLYAKVQGFVQEIAVDRGSVVAQGQLLVLITAPEFEAQCNAQKAKL